MNRYGYGPPPGGGGISDIPAPPPPPSLRYFLPLFKNISLFSFSFGFLLIEQSCIGRFTDLTTDICSGKDPEFFPPPGSEMRKENNFML
mgnify:CR=1 FL=1